MASVDLAALAAHVRAIVRDQRAKAPATGDAAMDASLADLARLHRANQPLETAQGPFWN